ARLGKQFYVLNQPGAGSNTASGAVAAAPADGHTLLVVSTGFIINPHLFTKVPYDPVKDFAPVTVIAISPNLISVHPSVP
ncbi:tripartite tricarboxylate transporter substrate-binding protein, partial [Enterococcus faecium]